MTTSRALFPALSAQWPARSGDPALITDEETLTYSELETEIGRMHAALLEAGATTGSRVVVTAGKSLSYVILYLACLRAGVVFVPLNPAGTPAETRARVHDVDPVLVIDDAALGAFVESPTSERTTPPAARLTADDLAAILFTSGTTGRPKGAMLTQENLRSNAQALASAWRMTSDDVVLHVLPVFHAHGLFVALHLPLLVGGAIRLQMRFDAARAVELLEASTVFMGVPTHYNRLLGERTLNEKSCARMRLFVSGSAPLPASTWRRFKDRTGHEILERYGMTETGMLASNPYDGERVPGTVGFPLPAVSTRLRSNTEVSGADVGELEVLGPGVSPGYWRDVEGSKAARSNGWFSTGDLARVDRDGRLSLVGRARDLIISGGLNVYPAEIEQALDGLDAVAESAVIGLPHSDLGEAVAAVVVSSTARRAGDEALLGALRRTLAAYKCPKSFHWVEELPRNAMGKVDKQALRTRFAATYSTE